MNDQPAHPLYPGIQIVPRDALERVTREWNTTPPPDLDAQLAEILQQHVWFWDPYGNESTGIDSDEAISRIKALFGLTT